jgi:predicted enzyme related to lactoylglutathione lyase
VHVAVDDLDRAIRFYSTLFGTAPSVLKPDYAKWMLDDPRVNLAISAREGRAPGVDHLGIQVDTDGELRTLGARLKSAGESTRDEADATCCYARSDKVWVHDPSGIAWESFRTFGEATVYGEDAERATDVAPKACCGPARTAA